MVALNGHGEICDVLDVSQFVPGKSAFECVAYSAALLRFAGKPGQGPTGTALQASNLAQYWYGREEGGDGAANKNGMSVAAMETMLAGMGLSYRAEELQDAAYNLALLHLCMREGRPCIACGAETGMHDLALGDRVPYNWTPTGNHAIVVTGIDVLSGDLLVHDCANVDQNGNVRPGPRLYDASKLQLVSVTSVQIGEEMIQPLSIDMPNVGNIFRSLDANHWESKATGRVLHDAHLKDYIANGQASLLYLGDLISSEQYLANGDSVLFFAGGARRWVKATGKVESFDMFSAEGQAILRRALSVPAPAPEVPQDHAAILQIKDIVGRL